MVKTKEGSRAMEGLKTASNAVTKATDALVKAAQRVVKKPDVGKEAEAKLKQVQQQREGEKIQQAVQSFKKEISGFFDFW